MNRRTKARLQTAMQFVIWWGANSLYAIDAQKLLQKFESPFLVIDLVFVQITVGMMISYMISFMRSRRDNSNAKKKPGREIKPFAFLAVIIGILHIFATTLTNFSYLAIGSSSTLVWKLTEPFSAVVLKKVLLGEPTTTTSVIGVFFVVFGVLTYSANDWNLLTFSPIILANILFPTRNAIVKLDQKRQRSDHKIHIEERYFGLLCSSLPFGLFALAIKLFFANPILQSIPYLVKNAILFNAYQFSSIALLEKLDALTHSLANTMKRFTGILLSAVVHGEQFSERHVAGLLMAAIGFPLYAQGGKLQSRSQFKRSVLGLAVFATMMVLFVDIAPSISFENDSLQRLATKPDQSETKRTRDGDIRLNESTGSFKHLSATIDLAQLQASKAHLEQPYALTENLAKREKSMAESSLNKASGANHTQSKVFEANSTDPVFLSSHGSERSVLESDVLSESAKHAAYRDSLRQRGSKFFVMAIKYVSKLEASEYIVDKNNILAYRGNNIGNFVWEHAAYDVLPDFSTTIVCEEDRYPCALKYSTKEHPRTAAVYWATSNIFETGDGKDFKFFLDMARVNVRIIMVGAGLQASFGETEKNLQDPDTQLRVAAKNFKQAPENLQFLSMMENKSNPILMRGDMTLQTSQLAGYNYGISAGCPSLFINKDIRLGQSMQRKYEQLKDRIGDRSLKVAINLQNEENSDEMFLYFMRIYQMYPNSIIFAQSSNDAELLGKVDVDLSRVRLYQTVEEWRAGMREMDVSFGPRIHGNMVALAESVPVFVAAPDYRVLELVRRMKIPHLSYFDKRLKDDVDVAEIMYQERINGDEFDKNRCGIAKLYRGVFEEYGFGVSSHVRQISELC